MAVQPEATLDGLADLVEMLKHSEIEFWLTGGWAVAYPSVLMG